MNNNKIGKRKYIINFSKTYALIRTQKLPAQLCIVEGAIIPGLEPLIGDE